MVFVVASVTAACSVIPAHRLPLNDSCMFLLPQPDLYLAAFSTPTVSGIRAEGKMFLEHTDRDEMVILSGFSRKEG